MQQASQNPFSHRTMQQYQPTAAAGRGGMAPGPQTPVAMGARILSPRMGGIVPPSASRGMAQPPPQLDVFSALTPGVETLTQPLANVQTDPDSLRTLTGSIDQLSVEIGQIWRKGVEMMLAQPPGPRDAVQKIQTFFGLMPMDIDHCSKMLGFKRVEIAVHDTTLRRNRMLAVAALGMYAKSQAQAILAAATGDPKIYKTSTQRLRDEMAKGNLHAQLILSFMKTTRSGGARM